MCKASNDLIFLQYDITDNHSTAYKNLQFRNNKNEELHNFLNLLYRMIHFFKKKKSTQLEMKHRSAESFTILK